MLIHFWAPKGWLLCLEAYQVHLKMKALRHFRLCYLMTKPSARKRIVDDDETNKGSTVKSYNGVKKSRKAKREEREDVQGTEEDGGGEMFSCLICGQQFR